MGEYTTLMARDGHEFQAWLAAADGRARGAVLVLQEIFGVNHHIRSMTDSFAAAGYTAIAPCLFDRVRRGIELDYSDASAAEGRGYALQDDPDTALRDVAAAHAVVRHCGRVGAVGYCWGGTLAHIAARRLPLACAVVYYGKVAAHLGERPRCPVMYHFGADDALIPPADIERLRAAEPQAPLYIYAGAGHGFNCEERASYAPAAATLARTRTLEFLARNLENRPHETQ